MNALIVLRIILVVVLIVSVDFIIKLNRTFKIDKRVSRYSIDSIIDDDNTIIELLSYQL